jgi:hypothetical protein
MLAKRCDIEHCGNPPRSKGSRYCEVHYYRIRRTGHAQLPVPPPDRIGADGYRIDYNRSSTPFSRQHRRILFEKIGPGEHRCFHCQKTVSWDKTYPKDLDGLVVDHLDDNKANNEPTNLVPSCAACNTNRAKGRMLEALRRKHGITWNGETRLPCEWADLVGISAVQFRRRLETWPLELAVTAAHCGTGPKRGEHSMGRRAT